MSVDVILRARSPVVSASWRALVPTKTPAASARAGPRGSRIPQLIITLQPDEGMALTTTAKVPGQEMRLQSVALDFDYSTSFPTQSPQAYERLIRDAINADATLFQHADEVEAAWRIVQPLLERWQADSFDLRPYPAGSEGPVEAVRLRDTGRWRKLIRTKHH